MENITSKGTIFGTLIAQAGPKGDTGKTGDRGLTGETGYSPVKGIDYFTQEDISEIRKGIEGDLTGEYNKNAIEKTNIFNTNAKETTTSFDLNAENKTKEYNDNALAEIEKYNSNAIEKSNNFDTNFENKTSKFDSNYDEKTKEFNDNNDLGIQNYNNNAKKQMEIFDANFTEKLEAFNNNAGTKFNGFNTNSDKALAEYNKNHTAKMKEFDDNYDTKTKTFDDNAAAKLDEYNKNDKTKTDAYNANDKAKTEAYNNNASNKEETFNTNAEVKQNEFDENASDKLAEYNQNAKELINKVEQVQAENEALKAENKLIKEQIPSANVSGNNIHIEDSGTLDFDWKIRGGHKQESREGYNSLDMSNAVGGTDHGITCTINTDGSYSYVGTATGIAVNIWLLGGWNTTNVLFKIDPGTYYIDGVQLFYINTNVANAHDEKIFTFTETQLVTGVRTLQAEVGKTYNELIYPIIAKSDKILPWEQYGASPSPDYPSEIETVGSNKNELDIQNIIVGGLVNGNIVSNIISRLVTKEPIPVKSSTTYNINFNEYGEFKGVRIGIHSLDSEGNFLKDSGWLNFSNTKQIIYTTAENCKSIRIVFSFSKTAQTVTSNTEYTEKIVLDDFYNMKFKLEKGTVATPYSPFGMGSVETDVVNKNLLNIINTEETTKGGITYSIKNGILKMNGTATDNLLIELAKNIKIKKGKYTYSSSYIQSGLYISFDNLGDLMISATAGKKRTFELTEDTTYKTCFIWIDKGTVLNNIEIKLQLEVAATATDFVEHQSQTAIMPIQQEMLTGDYISNVEHHEWGKLVLDGEKYGCIFMFPNGRFVAKDLINAKDAAQDAMQGTNFGEKYTKHLCCTHLSVVSVANQMNDNLMGISFGLNMSQILIKLDDTTEETNTWTSETINAYLKQQYEAGTPIIIYYKLAETLDLPLTTEQKAIRNQKLYTYKNITNIDVDNELASIEVKYKKDLETEHDKLQNQIDEIKQLISTTETSALLLDNLQKDVEMEVE